MRRLLLSLLGVIVSIASVNAGKVTEQQALQKAQQFMKGKKLTSANTKALSRSDQPEAMDAFYIFNAENKGGFVIVSGDDRMPEVLGYANNATFDEKNAPDGLKWLLGYYRDVAKHIDDSRQITKSATRTEKPAIAPLMITEWGQDYPYNLQCPFIGSSQCITGCVATAMAQVMNYCQWPIEQTTSIKSFTSYSNKIEVPELKPTTFDWNNMNVSEISKLMRYCSQSIEMDYGLNTSGAFTEMAASALMDNFGYDSGVKAVSQFDYTEEEWEDLMYNELAAKRAILFAGSNNNGLDGHAFVLHGYDSGRFYINWGWEGIDDGYFVLTRLNLEGNDYSYYQKAIIGIQPPGGVQNNPLHPIVTVEDLYGYLDDSYHWRESDGGFMELEYSIYVKSSIINQPVQIGLGLYNENGLQKVLYSTQHTFSEGEQYEYHTTLSIDQDIADGDYYIYPISRKEESDEWQLNVHSDVNYLKMSIHDNLRKLQVFRKRINTIVLRRPHNFVSIVNIEGIYYDLYEEMGKNRAIVIPANGGYKGDVVIPDHVTYDGVDYLVYESCSTAFDSCLEMTSLSTSMTIAPHLSICPLLTKVVFREGVQSFNGIFSCDLLEQLEFPQSTESVEAFIVACPKLETLRFKNPERLSIKNIELTGTNNLSNIYFHQITPPDLLYIDGDVEPIPGVTIHVPKGTLSSYQSSIWKHFTLIDDVSVEYDKHKIYWGYCQSTDAPDGRSLEIEDVRGLDREFAIRVPAELMTAYKGCKITAVQFYASAMDMDLADYVFITKSGEDYISKQVSTSERNSWVTTRLSTPVIIDGEELYVGIGRRDNIRISYSADKYEVDDGILWMRNMNPNMNEVAEGLSIGKWESPHKTDPVCLRFIIEGEDLPYDLHINGLRTEGRNLYATIFSRTPDFVDSFTLNWELDNGENGSQVITEGIVPNGQGDFLINLPANLKGFIHDIQFEITDIIGKPDAIPENNNKVYSIELQPETTYPRTAVMESLTGTWCGYSIRCMVGMQLLKQDYGDRFIPIALHVANEFVSDVMHLPEYEAPIIASSSVPECTINRGKWVDPYVGKSGLSYGIKDDVENVINQKAPAALGVDTRWTDSEKTSIEITTSTVFGGDDDRIPYQLGYVLLEDGLHGEGEDWYQTNAYSNNMGETYFSDPNLTPYVDLPQQMTNVTYNHVPVAAWGTFKGIEGTIPESVKGGDVYEYTFKADITDKTIIQNKDNLSVVVLLLNKNTGDIINAVQCKMGESIGVPRPNNKESITISGAKQVTYMSDKDLDFTGYPDLKAYVATGYDKASGTIWLTRVKEVPANTGFLLMGEADTYEIPVTSGGSSSYYMNMFKGTIEGTTIQTTEGDYTNYYLSNGDAGVGFYKVQSSVELKPNRAYLSVPTEIPAVGTAGSTETIKVSAAGQVPYYNSQSLDFSSLDAQGVKAYTATGYDYSSGTIWLTRVKQVPAETGILIMAPQGEYPVPTASVASVYANMFKGTLTGTTIQTHETIAGEDYINYYLSSGDAGVGFYKVTKEGGVTIGANRCYLPIKNKDAAAGTRSAGLEKSQIAFEEADEVIGIQLLRGIGDDNDGTTDLTPALSKGEGEWYTLQGQRVAKPGKGLYIRNGKVVVIR